VGQGTRLSGPLGRPPVLKLPPELALPAVRVLAQVSDPNERKQRLLSLRPSIPGRTLLNAYVIPSLKELRLFEGTLKSGTVTRYGRAIATAADEREPKASELFARQLLAIDRERVGFVDWLAVRSNATPHDARRSVFAEFIRDVAPVTDERAHAALLDRLGKWVGYLLFFNVLRGDPTPGATGALSADSRHVRALSEARQRVPTDSELRNALLEAYAASTTRVGSRLYIPVALLRDQLGSVLEAPGVLLTDAQIDAILRRAPELLRQHSVTFSPFSGPSRGGLELPGMYAGFVSIRRKRTERTRSTKQ